MMGIQYNDLENIDALIEKLEANLPTSTVDDVRVKKAVSRRTMQIEELKRIRDAARREAMVEAELARIENGSDEIEEVINGLKKLVKIKKEEPSNSYSQNSYSSYSSESRNSESNYYPRPSYTPSYSSYSSESRSSESRW